MSPAGLRMSDFLRAVKTITTSARIISKKALCNWKGRVPFLISAVERLKSGFK